jgi:hypothetical protein
VTFHHKQVFQSMCQNVSVISAQPVVRTTRTELLFATTCRLIKLRKYHGKYVWRLHKVKNHGKFNCVHYDEQFSSKFHLKRQTRPLHKGTKNHPSPTCKVKLMTVNNLKWHLKDHDSVVKCKQCENAFSCKRTLKVHIDNQHNQQKVLFCPVMVRMVKLWECGGGGNMGMARVWGRGRGFWGSENGWWWDLRMVRICG